MDRYAEKRCPLFSFASFNIVTITTHTHTHPHTYADNIMTIRKWCTEKFGIDEEEFNKNFGVPGDLDYLD